jgi:predicted ATPase/DNA-binding SARP family transcriptional activator/DNA-binding CsgD family transcriptional regulator
VRVRLLGGFEVSIGSRTVRQEEWRLKKAAALVKLLALAPAHRLHREQVMDRLWPYSGRRAASNSLRKTLHATRRVLDRAEGSRYMSSHDEQLVLCPNGDLWVDVEAFKEAAATARRGRDPAAYRAALDLYAGDLLPEDRYEEWAEGRRQELRSLCLSLLVELAGLYEERGEHERGIEPLQSAAAEEPTLEEAHAGLMRLYALQGREAEALAQYERLREALSARLGMEPGSATRRLHEDIAAGRFPPVPTRRAVPSQGEETPDATKLNLPAPRDSFVGREQQMVELKRAISMTRLLTLTGAGGSGKTRLALEVARDIAGAYPDGVWLVELASLTEGGLVPQQVASVVGVREQPNRSFTETLVDALCNKRMLIVLDNCEHLVGAAAHLVDVLLDSCPRLRIMATSREALGTVGELRWSVPSLSVPDIQRPPTVGELETYESARLFAERARQRNPSFVLTAGNAEAVSRVCRQLEGLPLAIELAAARMEALSAEQLASRLHAPLKVLSRGERTAEPRHRSLWATLEWSHKLLGEHEQALFRRLSVFAGGWTLEAAEEVCSGEGIEEGEVLNLLSELVERSLVVAEAGDEEALRFGMLELVRQYAREELEESGESEGLRSRHAGYYLALAEQEDAQDADPGVRRPRPVAWLRRMEAEQANLRAALGWSLDQDAGHPDGHTEGRRVELGLRLATALFWFWQTHDYQTEGRSYLERALSDSSNNTTTSRLRAQTLDAAGGIAGFQGDIGAAKALLEEGLALYRKLGDEEGIASTLTDLGMIAVGGQREDIPLSAVMEELGELKPSLKSRNTLAWLHLVEGGIAVGRGDLEDSVAHCERSLKLFREIRDARGILSCLLHLGMLALVGADYEGAVPMLRESLRLARDLDYTVVIQCAIYSLACVAASREQPVLAAHLWGAVEGLEEAYGVRIASLILSVTDYEGRLGIVRSHLGEEACLEAWAEGKAMALERAVEYSLSEDEQQEPPVPLAAPERQPPQVDERAERLTPREQEIAILVARGITNRQIASELFISERTVDHHVSNILKKLDVGSRGRVASRLGDR